MRFTAKVLVCLAFLCLAPAAQASATYVVRYDRWSEDDERGYRDFVAALGEDGCTTVDACLHSTANPYRFSDPAGTVFESDCADLPYVLRFYYAWKRALPFSYEDAVLPRSGSRDFRYSRNGNYVTSRRDVPGGTQTGMQIIAQMSGEVSSASFRIHPDLDFPLVTGHLFAGDRSQVDPAGGRCSTIPTDTWRWSIASIPTGRVRYFDAHPDSTLTRSVYDLRFTRTVPAAGAGFKNWRPQVLVGATRRADGTLTGGHIELARNSAIADFSTEQFYGNDTRPDDDAWASGWFKLDGEITGYYDYVRARLSGGQLHFDPVKEVARDGAIQLLRFALQGAGRRGSRSRRGIQRRPEPDRLPANIYGTDGDWGDLLVAVARCPPQDRVQGAARCR